MLKIYADPVIFCRFLSLIVLYWNVLQVLKRLVRRRLMYHSYSMQVHGYVPSPMIGDGGSFTLVHGVGPSLSKTNSYASTHVVTAQRWWAIKGFGMTRIFLGWNMVWLDDQTYHFVVLQRICGSALFNIFHNLDGRQDSLNQGFFK